MRGLLVSLTGLLLTACSSACGVQTDLSPNELPPRQWDERLMPYVDEFYARAEAVGIKMGPGTGFDRSADLYEISFGDQVAMGAADRPAGKAPLGVCMAEVRQHGARAVNAGRRIIINDMFLTSLGTLPTEGLEADRLRRVMMHELTHCVFGFMGHWGSKGDIQYAVLTLQDVAEHDYEEVVNRHFDLLGMLLK